MQRQEARRNMSFFHCILTQRVRSQTRLWQFSWQIFVFDTNRLSYCMHRAILCLQACFCLHKQRVRRQTFFQMSQKKRLEILRCVGLLKVLSKKRSFFGSKNSATVTVGNHLNPSRPGTLCSAGTPVAVCYAYSTPILPVLLQRTCGFFAAFILARHRMDSFEC
jgi:hypothetical protein